MSYVTTRLARLTNMGEEVMEGHPLPNRKRIFFFTLMFSLLALALITVLDQSAEARRKKPGPATGSCECDCNSNEQDSNGHPYWTGSGLVGTGVTTAACFRNTGQSCVVMSPYGLKNGSYGGCLWTNTSGTAVVSRGWPTTIGSLEPRGTTPKWPIIHTGPFGKPLSHR
jgi:hypothetical protein